MNLAKLIFVIIIGVLLVIHIIFLSTNFYGNCEYTGEEICKLCINGEHISPCECEKKQICTRNPEMFILPSIMFFLAILNFYIPNNE